LIRSQQQRSIKNKDEAAYLKAAALRIKLGGFDKDTLQNFDPERKRKLMY
jgi:hypothetical protein